MFFIIRSSSSSSYYYYYYYYACCVTFTWTNNMFKRKHKTPFWSQKKGWCSSATSAPLPRLQLSPPAPFSPPPKALCLPPKTSPVRLVAEASHQQRNSPTVDDDSSVCSGNNYIFPCIDSQTIIFRFKLLIFRVFRWTKSWQHTTQTYRGDGWDGKPGWKTMLRLGWFRGASCYWEYTLPKTNSWPLKIGFSPQKEGTIFQPSIF